MSEARKQWAVPEDEKAEDCLQRRVLRAVEALVLVGAPGVEADWEVAHGNRQAERRGRTARIADGKEKQTEVEGLSVGSGAVEAENSGTGWREAAPVAGN